MKKMLFIFVIVTLNINAEVLFKIGNTSKFEVIDSKNNWIKVEDKCMIIESYSIDGSWIPQISNQETDFNQNKMIKNYDKLSCTEQEYNERLNQYREIGNSIIKIKEKEDSIENRLISVIDTGLIEEGSVFNCGVYNPLLTTLTTEGFFNVNQECQQNQIAKYIYSTGEEYIYERSIKNKSITKNIEVIKENEIINNISCSNWNDKVINKTSVEQERTCDQLLNYSLLFKYNNEIIERVEKNENITVKEIRIEPIICQEYPNGYIYYGEYLESIPYEYTYRSCAYVWNGSIVFQGSDYNQCQNIKDTNYKYEIDGGKPVIINNGGAIVSEEVYGICRYKIK